MKVQKMEMAGVELNVPMPKETNEVMEVTEMALPASSRDKAILLPGG